MSYNIYNNKLQTHNSSLEDIITRLNNLPDAGSGGLDTSDATASTDEIFAGETAYTASGKVTGTFTIQEEITTQQALLTNIEAALANKVSGGAINLQDKTITTNGTYTADEGYDGLKTVTVSVTGSASGEISFKTFTCDADRDSYGLEYINPFVEGWTWEEFVQSPLNYNRNNGIMTQRYSSQLGKINLANAAGTYGHVSIDGTNETCVLASDIIQAIKYKLYVEDDPDVPSPY